MMWTDKELQGYFSFITVGKGMDVISLKYDLLKLIRGDPGMGKY